MEAPGQQCYRKFVDVKSIEVYQLNDCKNMHSIMLQLKMSRNVAACYRRGMSLPLRRQKSAMGSMYFSFENERLPLQSIFN